jgi:uncharacterized iron-regulated membrane protein
MDQRKYNIYFHTHTISGIIIAALLFVIFFAGSFSFFKDDLTAWQKGKSHSHVQSQADFNYVLDSMGTKHHLLGRNFDFYILRSGQETYVNMSVSQDTTISKPEVKSEKSKGRRGRGSKNEDSAYFLHSFADKSQSSYEEGYNIGEFLYRLHFLAQLNQIPIRLGTPFGYLIAGIVSFLFLFALITGVFLHWDKIKNNFFLFRPWSKWKTVWTDMHTVLGVIGFPFQLVFAITGIILIVNFALIGPFSKLLYNGDQEELYQDLKYNRKMEVTYSYQPLSKSFDVNAFVNNWMKEWPESDISRLYIRNYGDKSMQIALETKPKSNANFAGSGYVRMQVLDGKQLEVKSPKTDATYVDWVKSLVYHLHFGDYGGRTLRIVYFVLGLLGCVVIISGIMIWLVAREKPNIPTYKRKFNFWAANLFVSISLSMLPVTAFTLIMLKFSPTINQSLIYNLYFYSWLVMIIYLLILRDLTKVNKHTLVLSAILSLGVPIANGLTTNLWLWNTLQAKSYDIFFIDMLFMTISLLSVFAFFKVKKQGKTFKILK